MVIADRLEHDPKFIVCPRKKILATDTIIVPKQAIKSDLTKSRTVRLVDLRQVALQDKAVRQILRDRKDNGLSNHYYSNTNERYVPFTTVEAITQELVTTATK